MSTKDHEKPELVLMNEVHIHRPQYANRRRLLRLRDERRIRTALIGRRVYFDLSDLDRWEEGQTTEATS